MERIYSIDFIKFFAITAVVIIHIFPLDGFTGYFIIDNIARFAVPFFFAASGYFFAQKMIQKDAAFLYLKTYVIKLMKIYIVWLIFYAIYDVLIILLKGNHIQRNLIKYFDEFTFANVLYYGKGTSGYQLWFLTALIWCTIILYIFIRYNRVTLLFILSLLFNVLGVFGQAYINFFEFPFSNTRDALFFGLFYTTLGAIFAFNVHLKKIRKISGFTYLFLALIYIVIQVMEGYLLDKVLDGSHGEYYFSTILVTAFLFYFALNHKKIGKGIWITKVGGNALGIYIIHVFFLDLINNLLKYLDIKQMLSENLFWNIFYTILIFILSYYTYQSLQIVKKEMKD
ncbi:acyltransferase [Fictibacillus phosphorivorans]|uniref:acyltransferase n=1 Tax=Fictibacillus phosphorivorans TaxID=1221500 RepID=UPI002040F5F9|nr:acyltransferase [Fictibacillus phosphorivorans]MCM3719361.1 acyltransferase [Fictibacillus phosphorivorans]MCM3776982.1 acyltransferase [Fictibacillus phosphorivorans]